MDDIAAWLEEIGLGQHVELLRANDVTAAVLPELTDQDLSQLGLSLGHRRLLLKAIRSLARSSDDAGVAVAPTPAGRAGAVRPQAERRQLTVMFVDLVGSTALAARLDPEDMRSVITGYQNVCSGLLRRYEGHVAKFMGDGVLAYFGWPRAHEDEAERAVRAGLALAATVGKLKAPDGEALAARIGIATGLVVVGDLIGEGGAQEQAVVGETPNLAARLQALAAPGQVVVAYATRRLLGAGFEIEDLGERELKGIGARVQAYAVTGERPVESRFEAMSGPALLPMVGRDQELALLLERWAQAKTGEGQGVLLVGEAGIGKSRISRALLDALAEEPHFRVRYQCSPYHTDSALWPVIQQLNYAAGLAADDALETRLDKLEALLDRVGGHGAAPLIADLLGLDGGARYGPLDLTPQAQRARTLDALVEQMLGLAARQPVLVVVEDAHWIDPTMLELIEQSLDRIAAARVLFLLTSRPDQQPKLAAQPHITRLTLNRLGRAGVEAIVARLGGDRLPAETIDTIIARTDGVPLFVEELTKAVLETGETAIPASLHDSLMARLDRIPEAKEVAQIAATIGREFDYALLAAVVDQTEPDLCSALDKLAAAELIFRRGTPAGARYAFKHTLVRDAAYDSLLKNRRRAVHGRIATALEAREATGAEMNPVELVHHHLLADAPERALEPLRRTAERAAALGAITEALVHYRKALELLAHFPDRSARRALEADLFLGLGIQTQLRHGAGSPEPQAMFERALELATEQGFGRTRFSAAWNLWRVHTTRADFEEARTAASNLTLIARDTREAELVLQAHHANWWTLDCVGEIQAALDHVEQARRDAAHVPDGHARLFGGHDALVCGAGMAAKAHLLMGHMADAEREIRACLSRAERLGDRPTLGNALDNAITFGLWRRDHDFLSSLFERLLELGEPEGLQDFVAFGRFTRGWVAARSGGAREGETDMRTAIGLAEAAGRMFDAPFWQALLAETLADAGRLADAEEACSKALEQITRTSAGSICESEVRRIRGHLAVRYGRVAESIQHLEGAIALARDSGSRLLELRAATSLARIRFQQGERQKAHDLLAPVYGWFTEGFDTADLIEAKELLDALR